MTKKLLSVMVIAVMLAAVPALAQQTGSVSGRVTSADGEPLPGVTVEARGDVLPQPRVATTSETGRYALPHLPPGQYDLTFSLQGMGSGTRRLTVLLQQDSVVDVTLGLEGFEEEIQVLSEVQLVDPSSAEIRTAISNEFLERLPVAQQYRDLLKLIPGVQYTQDQTRGPSAGGNGQDNVYQFDGSDVSLPLFGTLSAEPSSHDVDQVSIVKGGAKAIDFNRSGGFTINTVSKSGTSEFHGELSYQIETEDTVSDFDPDLPSGVDLEVVAESDQERDWTVANVGGPILRDRLFFYASYYRPTIDRVNRGNVYGEVPDFEQTRDEYFGKLTFTPTGSVLVHASYRDSDREDSATSVGSFSSASTSEGGDVGLTIGILEASWLPTGNSLVSANYTDFDNETASRPDTQFGFQIAVDGSVGLDVDNLDQMGHLFVPQPIEGESAFNTFIAPIIERYGFLVNGERFGGGDVGGGTTINNQDFFRESYQVGYDYSLNWGPTQHDLHVGYQFMENEEDLSRLSNGWGSIEVSGGRFCVVDDPGDNDLALCSDVEGAQQPVFYSARFQQQSLPGGVVPSIGSSFESQNIELNDTLRWNNWTFNIGVLLSQDTYFGQGLRPNSGNISGFETAVGNEYEMYEIDFDDMIQPRLGAVWAYNGSDTIYANYARYHPSATSLPRAASWDRNLQQEVFAYFDADGNFLHTTPVSGSSGKFFQDDLEPRFIDEYMLGTSRQLSSHWGARAFARYRYGAHFWEDTNNDARSRFEPPPGIPTEDYIPDLDQVQAEIGGSSYVIAQLDGAFTKYWEASFETDYRGEKIYFNGSYVWSHYYGNFDQDNTTTDNDQNIFIGSSFLADGAGRQVWDFKNGDLRGDRRHQLKLFGSYDLDWNATVGAFATYLDGQPWEIWDSEVYRHLTSSTSDTNRYAEPAGSRRTDDHYQLDLNYTQNFIFGERYTVQLAADIYNVVDKQTGYNIQNKRNEAGLGVPRDFFDPRTIQLSARFRF
ncbi:MAG: carboxypeptidase regulatory-like domain-containing protein [Thermoanaerobaculia bacterium]